MAATHWAHTTIPARLDRLQAAANELASSTTSECIAVQADVRNPKQLQDAVAKTVEKFGRIDFVICGKYTHTSNFQSKYTPTETCRFGM